jgi:hypothetical protein
MDVVADVVTLARQLRRSVAALAACLFATLLACTAGQAPPAGRDSGGEADAPGPGGDPGPSPSDELFDPELVPHFQIELPAASLAALARAPAEYVSGTFRYGNESVNNVGVRIKGEATKRTLREKAAFKLKFDAFVPDQTFRGLRRLTLNNLTEDATFLAERLAYQVFRAARVPAPRAANALVSVNGTLFGLYANVETEDKTFLRRWFASDDGNLYEEGQRDFLPGNETTFELETNEPRNDRSDLTALIDALARSTPETLLEDLGRQLDVPHFFRFTALEAIVNQWDMYAYTRFYPNNFRLYRDPSSNKFVFLPWGMDMALKDFRGQGDHIAVFALAHENNRASAPVTAGLIFRLCMGSAPCKAAYSAVLRDMVTLFEGLALEQTATRAFDQVRPHVLADPRKEFGQSDIDLMRETMLRIIRERPARIRAQLGGQ